ncbi:SDR family NAD(P)-dependent oxidoreductase [Kineococcus rhizosphaerae]|uniref:2-hydroxycyclohexanecarboxyl-CoA dehydrogenase n=1 Tax=Kineococcus rhizosphaerae TaxID=559628 RepID=A0A2T0QXA8_9ACTN|nr:SDR family NAD(P)-dependent oxidoreductase [Kineococcus rhizosphaerae]PRY10518.1 2-hydroxycyclohexanecarboxyl-CoA dehydrogenase [Kineococcus rhizosphaerae]
MSEQWGRGQVALVTGAAGGIGRATAQRLADAGSDLVLVDVVEAVHEVAADLRERTGLQVSGHRTDLADPDAVAGLADDVRRERGRLDSLLLVAGTVQTAAGIGDLSPQEWDRVLRNNLTVPYLVAHSFADLLSADGGGTLTAVSSWWGRSGHAYFAAYCAAKAGLVVLVQSLAAELAPAVRCNTVCPGNIDTSMHRDALASEAAARGIDVEQVRVEEWAKIPLQVAGAPHVIADALCFLASPRAEYVTGASLDVNGGVVFH